MGRTYFASYPPDVACATEPEAIEDIRRTYSGEYGPLDLANSRLAIQPDAVVGLAAQPDAVAGLAAQPAAVADLAAQPAAVVRPAVQHAVVGAALVVERGPWADAPDCPFLIELFTLPTHRRQGIAQALLTACLTLSTPLALRVQDNNTPAITLYKRFNFKPS
ncbi:GNAT family N-acetyltransferase [Kribbella endophytica]